jgi:hypothetical protein
LGILRNTETLKPHFASIQKYRPYVDGGPLRWARAPHFRYARSLMSRAGVRPDIVERTLGHVIAGVEGSTTGIIMSSRKPMLWPVLRL